MAVAIRGRAMTRREGKLPLMAVCVHEAGHAFMNCLCRLPFDYVTAVPDEVTNSAGHVRSSIKDLERRLEANGRGLAERLMRSAVAGEITQLKYQRRSFKSFHSSHDWQNAIWFANSQGGPMEEVAAWCDLVYIQTKNVMNLDYNWNAILALARELRSRKSISARAARNIVKKTLEF